MPIAGRSPTKLIKKLSLTVYKGGGAYGMCTKEKDQVNEDLLTFIKT